MYSNHSVDEELPTFCPLMVKSPVSPEAIPHRDPASMCRGLRSLGRGILWLARKGRQNGARQRNVGQGVTVLRRWKSDLLQLGPWGKETKTCDVFFEAFSWVFMGFPHFCEFILELLLVFD